MSDEANQNALSSLLKSAKRLSQASDAANALISSIQASLVEANFGIEHWAYNDPLEISDNDAGEEEHLVLGFYKSSSGWCLATKMCAHGEDEEGTHIRSWSWNPLLKAPRETRIEALRIMPKFLASLEGRIQQATSQVETAVQKLALQREEK
ncbi:MAG: hypothetical protein EPO35_00550 [Acidobacteria bacterium]|nr:MAG: hypothetical protein EPO35_00550 [Acidobacteriota bacterium]